MSEDSTTVEIHLRVSADNTSALDLLSAATELERDILQQCFTHGAVWLEARGKPQRLYDPAFVPAPDQQLHLYCNHSTLAECPYRPELIEDFTTFSIWYKPAGMLSQGSKWGDHWCLHRWVQLHRWPERDAFITHRLDRFTQGLMIVAHDKTSNRQLHRLFEQHRIDKTYRAVVQGLPPAGMQWDIDSAIDGRPARTRVRVLQRDSARGRSLLELQPMTGRKHQLRIHLARAGYPVVNDRRYGQPPFTGDLALQACALAFPNPMNGQGIGILLNDDRLLNLKNL